MNLTSWKIWEGKEASLYILGVTLDYPLIADGLMSLKPHPNVFYNAIQHGIKCGFTRYKAFNIFNELIASCLYGSI